MDVIRIEKLLKVILNYKEWQRTNFVKHTAGLKASGIQVRVFGVMS